MGVINLGALVEKLRKKLSGSGFITSTDYATASKGGVVKVGTTGGLQVSSGTLKGKTLADATAYASAGNDTVMTKGDMAFVSTGGGGVTVESLLSAATAVGTSGVNLTGKLSDYTMVLITYTDASNLGNRSILFPVSAMTLGADLDHATSFNTIGYGGTQYLFFNSGETVDKLLTNSENASVKVSGVFGIK